MSSFSPNEPEAVVTTNQAMSLTEAGYERLQKELEHLKTVKRAEIAERLRESKEHGEFSEDNNELDEIKFEQAMVETRIAELKAMFAGAQVLDLESLDTSEVGIGTLVHVQDVDRNVDFEVRIVCSVEADPDQDFISNESPMGMALIGRAAGEVVRFEAPAGPIAYKILKISK